MDSYSTRHATARAAFIRLAFRCPDVTYAAKVMLAHVVMSDSFDGEGVPVSYADFREALGGLDYATIQDCIKSLTGAGLLDYKRGGGAANPSRYFPRYEAIWREAA